MQSFIFHAEHLVFILLTMYVCHQCFGVCVHCTFSMMYDTVAHINIHPLGCFFVCLFGLFLWCIVQSVIFIAEFQSAVLLQFVLYMYMKHVSVVCTFTNILPSIKLGIFVLQLCGKRVNLARLWSGKVVPRQWDLRCQQGVFAICVKARWSALLVNTSEVVRLTAQFQDHVHFPCYFMVTELVLYDQGLFPLLQITLSSGEGLLQAKL